MNYIKQNHLSLLIILWLIVSPFLGFGGTGGVEKDFGLALRDLSTISNPFYFQQGLSRGGTIFATTTSGTSTLTNTNITQNGTLQITPALMTPAVLTLPTKANLTGLNPPFIPNAGDRITKTFINASTTLGSFFRVVGNSGVIVRHYSTTTKDHYVYGGDGITLDFWRASTSTDIYVDVSVFHMNP